MKKFIVSLILIGLFLVVTLSAMDQLLSLRRTAAAQGFDQQAYLPVILRPLAPTAAPTPTPQPTSQPTPPSTPIPTTPPDGIEPYLNAPACPSHDAVSFHGLWDGERGCHYNHTHYDDPHSVDDIFGTEFYGLAGGEISYPWQTFSAAGTENELKHGGYGWLVRRDLPCQSQYTDGCVRAFRAQFHGLGSNQGAYVRYHSYWLEALICPEAAPNDCGIIRIGGWQDTGDLMVDGVLVIDEPNEGPNQKLHYSGSNEPGGMGNSAFGTWYSSSPESWAQVAVQFEDMWGLINRQGDATDLHFFCDDFTQCNRNGSRVEPHVIGASVRNTYRQLVDPDGDGKANYTGYVDRYGVPAENCSDIDLDCVPLVLENVSLATMYQYRGNTIEYDVYFNGDPSGWIDYPN